MNYPKIIASLALIMVMSCAMSVAQKPGSDKLTVPLSDPSRPAHLKVGILNGSITVKGYAGKDVIVEAVTRNEDDEDKDDDHDQDAERLKRKGMRRIANSSTGLSVEEDNNDVVVGTGSMGGSRTIDLTIQVPVTTSMRLSTINDGDIHVSDIKSDLEVSNTNGSVTLSQISGSAVVDALNGEITVTFASVDMKKSMSFSSMNGDIDVTFPSDVKATLKMKTEQGDIYSDFDVKMENSTTKVEDNQIGKRGKYRVTLEKLMTGTINGGGSEILFKNFNGSIYIRKGK